MHETRVSPTTPTDRLQPSRSTTILCGAAVVAWTYVILDVFTTRFGDGVVCLAGAIAVGLAAMYALLRDWMASPRGHEATVAMRVGIKIGQLRRR